MDRSVKYFNHRKFEVPYNFDSYIIEFYKIFKDNIQSVYIPCYYEDSYETRWKMTRAQLTQGKAFIDPIGVPESREEWSKHIEAILEAGLEPNVLFQDPIRKYTDEQIQWYIDLGIKYFTVFQDSLAKQIRQLKPDAYIIASVTKVLNPKEIESLPAGLYDDIVLHFAYNHAYDEVMKLRDDINYTMLTNTRCDERCPAQFHWLAPFRKNKNGEWYQVADFDNFKNDGFRCQYFNNGHRSSMLRPEHLHYYDKKVKTFKVLDRLVPTNTIIYDLYAYARNNVKDFINIDEINKKDIPFFNLDREGT